MRSFLICVSLLLSACVTTQKPNNTADKTPVGKLLQVEQAFYDAAYSRSQFHVAGVMVNPAFMSKYGVSYCMQNASQAERELFATYMATIEKYIDEKSGYGGLFMRQFKRHGLSFGDARSRQLISVPNFDDAVRFESQALFKRCTVFIGYPMDIVKIKRFADSVSKLNISDNVPSYTTITKVFSEYELDGDAPRPYKLQRTDVNF